MTSVNIKDIARLAGVGVSTVSRALNNHPDVNKETKETIMQIIEEYNYVPNNSARNLKRMNSNTIGVLIKGIANPFFSKIVKIIEEKINENKYSMLLHQVDSYSEEIDAAVELAKEKRLQGIIFLGGNSEQNEQSCTKFASLGIPIVLCTITADENLDKKTYSSVTINDFEESYQAVNYLCGLGHRDIGIICGVEHDRSVAKLRLDGYCKALLENEIPLRPEYIKHTDEFSLACGYTAATELLSQCPAITAIYSLSDLMAIGACKAIFDSGLKIPENYSVMGFDGLDYGQFYHPAITTMKQPVEQIAEETANLLFEMIKNKHFTSHQVFPAFLVEGESCARPCKRLKEEAIL